MTAPRKPAGAEEARRSAQKILDSLAGEPGFAGSSLAAAGRRALKHFAGRDADPADPAELWGRRIGRALSLAAVIGLSIYLYLTYLR